MDEESQKCSMTGFIGILIQLLLGLLSFSVLVLKRFRESPKREWKIWMLDTSKQVISQLIAHFINLAISIFLTYHDASSDECLWYFTTNVLDNSIGVCVCVLVLTLSQRSLMRRKQFHLISGNYYEEVKEEVVRETTLTTDIPKNTHVNQLVEEKQRKEQMQVEEKVEQIKYKINYRAWLIQLMIWNGIVVLSKGVMFGIEVGLKPYLKAFTFMILGWIQYYPVFELMLVIVLVPVCLNALAFWVQDNFLMKKNTSSEGLALLKQNKPPSVIGSTHDAQ